MGKVLSLARDHTLLLPHITPNEFMKNFIVLYFIKEIQNKKKSKIPYFSVFLFFFIDCLL